MSTPSTDRKSQVDYGVQIRFIKDLHDTGGGYVEKARVANGTSPSSKYGVAVRVQGISGQPYVVLKDGQKGDSYGVQLTNPNPPPLTPTSEPPSPFNSIPKLKKEPADFTKPFSPTVNSSCSPVSLSTEDEIGEIFGSPLRRPPGDGQAGTQGEEEGGAGAERVVERSKSEPKFSALASEDERKRDKSEDEYNEAGLKPVRINAAGPKAFNQTAPGFTNSLGRYSEKKSSTGPPPQPFPDPLPPSALTDVEPALAIDTESLAPINKLISKFNSSTPDSAPQSRGRSGARQRLRFDERRRSRSLDARKDAHPEITSPTLNPYAAPLTASSSFLVSSAPGGGSLGQSPASAARVMAPNAPRTSFKSPEKFVAKAIPPAIAKKPVSTNHWKLLGTYWFVLCFKNFGSSAFLKETLSRSSSQSTEVSNGEEAQIKLAIYNILKDGWVNVQSCCLK